MGRPKLPRKICDRPCCSCFKPAGAAMKKDQVFLEADEFQALKLKDHDNLDQKKAARQMKISQPTFARVLALARQKLANALVGGGEIRIKAES